MSIVVLPLVAPCSIGIMPWLCIRDIMRLAKMTLSHQLKSASSRHIARSFDRLVFPGIFSKRTVTPLCHRARGLPCCAAKLMFFVCSCTSNGSSQMAL